MISVREYQEKDVEMIVSVVSMWLCRIVVSYFLIVVFHLGILGVWFGMFADWYVRGIGYLLRFKSEKWLERKAINTGR